MGLNRLKDESLFPEMEGISIESLLGNADASILAQFSKEIHTKYACYCNPPREAPSIVKLERGTIRFIRSSLLCFNVSRQQEQHHLSLHLADGLDI